MKEMAPGNGSNRSPFSQRQPLNGEQITHVEEQLMRRLMLTRAILAHFLRLVNFKRSRRSSAVVSLVLVQHLTMTVRHQPKTGLFFPKPLVSSLPPSYYSYVSSFM